MKTIRIISRHNTVAEAVKAINFDLSYNEAEGQRKIKDADAPCKRAQELGIGAAQAAYVINEGDETKILMLYMGQGIRFLREFSPFMSVLDNRDMRGVTINEREGVIVETGANFPKTPNGRRIAAGACAMCPEFALM